LCSGRVQLLRDVSHLQYLVLGAENSIEVSFELLHRVVDFVSLA
jgi:hypothetical protein